MTQDAPYLTAELPGIGGRLRARPRYFVVEEIPLRKPRGSGNQLRVFVEKERMSTPELVRQLASRLRIDPRSIHVAGNKDADALTRQWVSLPAKCEAELRCMELDRARILEGDLDDEPLATGELAGNRFEIAISNILDASAAARTAEDVLAVLESRGVPNFFGPQRFGTRGLAAEIGSLCVRREFARAADVVLGGEGEGERDAVALEFRRLCRAGDLAGAMRAAPRGLHLERTIVEGLLRGTPKDQVWKRVPQTERRMYLSAFQSRLFNRIVARRLPTLDRALLGDLVVSHSRGDIREVVSPESDGPAVASFRSSPTGLMVGADTPLAPESGEPGRIEREVLATDPVPSERLVRPLDLTLPGERRPLRIPVRDIEIGEDRPTQALWLRFRLPRGAFATTLLAEVRKLEPPPL